MSKEQKKSPKRGFPHWLDIIEYKPDMSAEVDAVFDDTESYILELRENFANTKHT